MLLISISLYLTIHHLFSWMMLIYDLMCAAALVSLQQEEAWHYTGHLLSTVCMGQCLVHREQPSVASLGRKQVLVTS